MVMLAVTLTKAVGEDVGESVGAEVGQGVVGFGVGARVGEYVGAGNVGLCSAREFNRLRHRPVRAVGECERVSAGCQQTDGAPRTSGA